MKILRIMFLAAIMLLPALQTEVLAWDDTGHMVVAFIAYNRLDPSAKAKVNRLFLIPAGSGTRSLVRLCGRNYNPVTIANWMDDLRDIASPAPFAEWHFTNFNPIFAPDFPASIDKKQFKPAEINILTQIIFAASQLQRTRNFDKTPQNSNDDEANAFALAYLVHLVGDVHQPLHSTTRYSKKHPDGDRGGNSFEIKFPEAFNKLHSFWDGAGGAFNFRKVQRPANNSIPAELAALAKRVTDAFPADATAAEWRANMTPEKWVEESNTIARDFAFNSQFITDNASVAPSQAYINEAQRLAKKRIAFAGYRLAETLNRIYGAP